MADARDIERARREAMATLDRLSDLRPSTAVEPPVRWSLPQPEPPKPERDIPTPAIAAFIDQRISQWLEHERMRTVEVVGQALGEVLDAESVEAKRDLTVQLAELKLELAKLANVLAEVRIASATDRGLVLDMPSPLQRTRSDVN